MRALIVDDNSSLRQSLSSLLHKAGYEVEAEADAESALRRATVEPFDVILCDLDMVRMDGLTFLRRYHAGQGTASLIMTAEPGQEDSGIAAMREGAYAYLPKPFRADEVALTLRKVEERDRLRREVETLRSLERVDPPETVVAESRVMRELMEHASRVARQGSTVLITGESGTGKEVLARAIHCMSARRERRFMTINCAAMPEALLDTELFGQAGGINGSIGDRLGLVEVAHEGTLLLDEISALPASLQAKLLRVLEDGEVRRGGAPVSRKVDVRVIGATTQSLEQAVERGEFRSDLYYRLNVVRLPVPPLRERREDVPALIAHFARQAAERLGHRVSITPHALALLNDYGWPGNVRELRNVIERAAAFGGAEPLDASAFSLHGHAPRSNGHPAPSGDGTYSLKPQVDEIERAAIQRALDAANGNRREAAQLLGVSLRTLFYKLRRARIE